MRIPVTLFLWLVLWTGSAPAQGNLPMVAIHDSELTRALESTPATNSTPTGPGTTGFQWWPTNWHYFTLPESLQEMFRSDGTPFAVVSDANISAGALLTSNGLPAYPIVLSLAAEAIRDDEIAQLTNYVAAGGFLFVGSSSFTRDTNGTSRGDFAIANAMGLHMVVAGLTNWTTNGSFTRVSGHRLISHIPEGTLSWQLPSASEEISWPKADHVPFPPTALSHLLWRVRPTGATVLAQGSTSPFLLVQKFGNGWIIYEGALQPVIGHGGWAPGMYSSGILRNAIEWAFQSAKAPVQKRSVWPYPYDAAVVFRHDMEAIPDLINSIELSSQYEFNRGAKGDYFFCTGQLRENMPNMAATIASLQRAVSNYGATVASHNGGLTNINTYSPPLTTNSYDYWHWGPDEVLDLNPAGYSNGAAYALASISNSLSDIQGWITNTNNGSGLRLWVAPYFNATREASYQIQEQLGIQITGDQKLGPFPHWTLSTQTSGKLYSFLTLPASDWFVGSRIGQDAESGHNTDSIHALVDYYYGIGGLINLYSHSSSDGSGPAGALTSEYLNYSLAKPRAWSINAAGIYNWWQRRNALQLVPGLDTNGNLSVSTLSLSSAIDTNSAVELLTPNPAFYSLQVTTNGVGADTNSYRTTNSVIKLLVGNSVTNLQVSYSLPPVAADDYYTGPQGVPVTVGAPGVLGNDVTGIANLALTAALVSGPSHGSLSLSNDGSFTYTPDSNFFGIDSFTYQAADGQTNSSPATVTLMITPPGYLFYDDLTRESNAAPFAPWTRQLGAATITNGVLTASSTTNAYGSSAYANPTWTNYSVQGRIQFSTPSAWGGGVGGRLDPATGAHYGAWVYPESSVGGSSVLKLIKFSGWTTWSFTPMQTVSLPGVGTNSHTVTLSMQGTNLSVYYDGVLKIQLVDNNFDQTPAFTNGGITLDMYSDPIPYVRTMDDIVAASLSAPLIMKQPVSVLTNAGATVTFSVIALGPGVAYQWFNGSNSMAGETNASLVLGGVSLGDIGDYQVVVSNSTAAVTSSVATLLLGDPLITNQPQSRTNTPGTTATFTVGAVGTPTLRYRWFKNGNLMVNGNGISGAASATLTITDVQLADAAGYVVTVSNAVGVVTSTPPALLTVTDVVNITSQPASRTNNAGTTATFSVSATGAPTLVYRWFRNGVILNNGGNISGATNSTLAISNVLGADAAAYTVVVSNSFDTTTSAPPAILTVIDPIITSQPQSRTNVVGTSAIFTVGFVGTTPAYQWRKGGSPINGETNASLTLPSVALTDAGTYSVSVSNAFGNPISSNAVLTVVAPPVIQSIFLTDGIATVTWTSVSGFSYRLQYVDDISGTNWSNQLPDILATGSASSQTNTISGDSRYYRVLVVP